MVRKNKTLIATNNEDLSTATSKINSITTGRHQQITLKALRKAPHTAVELLALCLHQEGRLMTSLQQIVKKVMGVNLLMC